MKKIAKFPLLFIVFILHLMAFIAINYALPNYQALEIVGAEVKRVDKNGIISKERSADSQVRDVYFVYTKKLDGKDKNLVFRNEDTRFGFPFYFKFNSADIQAKALNLANEKSLVQVSYYGYRVQIFNEFPNITSLKKITSKDELSSPIISYALYVIIIASLISLVLFINRKFN